MTTPYEQGGVTGTDPSALKALIDKLGGTQTATAPGLQADAPAGGIPGIEVNGGGINGAGLPPGPTGPLATTDYTQLGKYANKMGAYNSDKFNVPWDQRSEKYQIGTVLSNFDPNQGLTPDAIAALNAANIHGAKFSGSGDKLTVDNAGGYDRFGKGGTADIIGGFKNPNQDHGWGAWFVDDQGQPQQGPQGGSGMPSFGGSNINGMLQSDAQGNIQQALAAIQQPGMLQQLIAALGGGQ
jgi:hypothetical protein